MVKFRTQYDENYKSAVFDTDVGVIDDDYQVQQHMAEACDINNIMANYVRTGELTHINEAAAQYGDFSTVLDYQDGLNHILEAQAMFMELPATLRDRFNNDPGKFIEYATDEKNIDSLREMGLAKPKPQNVEATAEPKGGARTSSATADKTAKDAQPE